MNTDDASSYAVCYVCNSFVHADHVCPQAEKLNANPIMNDMPYIHGNALPSQRYGGVDYSPRGTV